MNVEHVVVCICQTFSVHSIEIWHILFVDSSTNTVTIRLEHTRCVLIRCAPVSFHLQSPPPITIHLHFPFRPSVLPSPVSPINCKFKRSPSVDGLIALCQFPVHSDCFCGLIIHNLSFYRAYIICTSTGGQHSTAIYYKLRHISMVFISTSLSSYRTTRPSHYIE